MKKYVVETANIRHNIEAIMKEVGPVPVIGVVKGNGYGLGTVKLGKFLLENGIKMLAVSRLEEAAALRKDGVSCDILLMSPTSIESEVETILDLNIISCVDSYESAVVLDAMAEKRGVKARVHIKLDTGFGRYGFLPGEEDNIQKIHDYMKNIEICGVFSHLSNAFVKSKKSVASQLQKFNAMVERMKSAGIDCEMVHIANSSAALRFPETRLSAVRIGSAFLGRLAIKNKWGLKKVGHLECEVSSVKWLPEKWNVGYADVFRTKRPSRIAVVPVGHTDGFGRSKLRDAIRFRDILRYIFTEGKSLFTDRRIFCEINGKKAPLIGRIGLTNIVLDVTDIECRAGDIVKMDVSPLMIDSAVIREYV